MHQRSPWTSIVFEIAERDRVSQSFDARNAVLPFRARWAGEQISRSRLRDDRGTLPFGAELAAQTEGARRQQRDPDYFAEHRAVLVPSDLDARLVFREQNLLQPLRRYSGERCGLFTDGKQEGRQILGPLQAAAVEIVTPSE